jgi:hypothetical protein
MSRLALNLTSTRASDPGLTPPRETVDQQWGEFRFPVAHRFVTESNTADQEHLRQIAQPQPVAQTPEYHEREDVGGIADPVQNSAAAFIELLAEVVPEIRTGV